MTSASSLLSSAACQYFLVALNLQQTRKNRSASAGIFSLIIIIFYNSLVCGINLGWITKILLFLKNSWLDGVLENHFYFSNSFIVCQLEFSRFSLFKTKKSHSSMLIFLLQSLQPGFVCFNFLWKSPHFKQLHNICVSFLPCTIFSCT